MLVRLPDSNARSSLIVVRCWRVLSGGCVQVSSADFSQQKCARSIRDRVHIAVSRGLYPNSVFIMHFWLTLERCVFAGYSIPRGVFGSEHLAHVCRSASGVFVL